MQLKFYKGSSAIIIDPDFAKIVQKSLEADSEIVKVLREEMEDIKRSAEKNWPVRMKKYGKSKNSREKFQLGFRIIPPNTIHAFLENTAAYAWAIRAGKGSKTTVREGLRVSDVLLVRPLKKRAKNITEKTANEFIRKVR